MRRFVLLLLLPCAAASPLLSAVVPDLPGSASGDEAVALWSAEPVDLSGWSLSDGEASWPIPDGTILSGEAWFTGNASAWAAFGGTSPVAVWSGLRLGNDGDDVRLVDPGGIVVDSFAWGDGSAPGTADSVSYTSSGLVYRRVPGPGGLLDTDSADDWRTPRMHRVGESDHAASWWNVSVAQPYACPDHCLTVWSDLLAGARERVVLHVYDLRAPWLADLLADAAGRADVQVLVQERPVGMDDDEEGERDEALRRVEAAGGEAWLATRGRYAYHHLKVLVVDDAVAVQSDNAVPSSFPEEPTWGTRGWGVVLYDRALADWVAEVLAADRAAWDVVPFEPGPPREVLSFPPRSGDHRPVALPPPVGPVRVLPVVTPEHTADPATDPVLAVVRGASSSVRVQQLDLRVEADNALGWSEPDGLSSALVDATRRGVRVSVQAAAPFGPGDDGNRPALDRLSASGASASEFSSPDLVLHNKGVVVDGRWAYVGSMNQNHHSRSNNREFGVLLDGPEAASWYAARFDGDGAAPRRWDAVTDDLRDVPATPVPTLFALALVVRMLRR